MKSTHAHKWIKSGLGITATATLVACGGGGGSGEPAIPQLSAATPGTLLNCSDLVTKASFANTVITSATPVAAGAVTSTADGVPLALPEHCVVKGVMNPRTGIDGKSYAINFEMRLPTNWNGRFFHQVNGGNDGDLTQDTTRAFGRKLGGSPDSNGLLEGFAVLTSDAGHVPDASYKSDPNTGFSISGQVFGLDPQARLDYGYKAVGTLTPMAKNLINAAYGRAADRSYMIGCSNGGRHSMVAASRYAADYDGILAGDPGFNLPRARIAEEWDSQALMSIAQSTDPATGKPAIWSAFNSADLGYVRSQILAKCDALDGVKDGMVNDVKGCQAAFNVNTDLSSCETGVSPNGSCISGAQKNVLNKIFGGAKTAAGKALYSDWPYDAGVGAPGWVSWKMGFGTGTGFNKYGLNQTFAGSGAYIFSTPPANPLVVTGLGSTLHDWTLNYNFEQAEALITGTNASFTESAESFMNPPNRENLSTLRNRGGKLLVFHGASDPVFSYNDTINWYNALTANHSGDAKPFARVFTVPGMNHCSGGPATDKFDMVKALVNWVEKGQAPDSIVASTRTVAQNSGLGTIPAGRSRPLCAYPKVAKYSGTGSIEDAANFSCQ